MFTHSTFMLRAAAVAGLVLAGAATAQAQVRRVDPPRQAISFNLGYFALRGEDSRADGDVLLADLSDIEPLAFEVDDFNGFTFGGEWLFPLGEYLEGGVGIGFYQRGVDSVYDDVVSENGAEIEQELKLRVIPMSATVRFLPAGRGSVQPYIGAGIGAFNWRYSEVGEFVDTFDYSIFRARYVADGTTVGPVILGGIRFPVADVWTVGGEFRWQKAEGEFDEDSDLLGDRIDLGGWSTNFTFALRF